MMLGMTLFLSAAKGQDIKSIKYFDEKPPAFVPAIFLPERVSLSERHEFGSIFSHNGEELYYAVDSAGKAHIRMLKLNNSEMPLEIIILTHAVFSYNDPMLSPDEKRLYFISNQSRDGGSLPADYDIWYIERQGEGWSAPINAGPAINSDGNEYYVSFTTEGNMYYSTNRKSYSRVKGDFNICYSVLANGAFQQSIPLGESVNSNRYEADVFIAPDESYLIFCADRTDGYGMGDLYISFKKPDGSWTKSKNMGKEINDAFHQLCPFVTRDGKYLFFTSNQDIFWVDAGIIDALR